MGSPPSRRRRRPLLTDSIDLGAGLSLTPRRLRLQLAFRRSDPFVKPIDEWRLRLALLSFLRSPPLSIPLPSDDDVILLRRPPDLHKRKRDEPVALGTLLVRDLSFLNPNKKDQEEEELVDSDEELLLRKKFLEWRDSVVERLQGIELNIEGVKYRMSVEIPLSDVFDMIEKSWVGHYASQLLDGRREATRRPDTIVVRGLPSRWFAEPRVSSKPSMLVTHTIFSVLGKIRNLNVGADDDLGENGEAKEDIVSGLNCKILVQFESHEDFYNAMKVLCGRAMQKEGSRLKVDYDVTWDKDGYFRNVQERLMRSNTQERGARVQGSEGRIRNEMPKHQTDVSRFDPDRARRKRFRD